MNGLIDRLSQGKQNFALAAVTALLAWGVPYAEATYTTWNLPPVLAGALGALLPYAALWVTTLGLRLRARRAERTCALLEGELKRARLAAPAIILPPPGTALRMPT